MYNDDNAISAGEINKFCYCPYQWYYERAYGRNKINELKRQRDERLGLFDYTSSNFIKGLNYHKKHHNNLSFKHTVFIVLIILILCVAAFFLYFNLAGGLYVY